LSIVSTSITIYAIWKFVSFTRKLNTTRETLSTNDKTLIIHCCLLILEALGTVATNIPLENYPKFNVVFTILPIINLIV